MINDLEDKVKWYCEECQKSVEGMQEENKELKQENIQVRKENQDLKDYIEILKDKIDKVEERLERQESKMEKEIDRRINKIISKKEDQILKKVNEAHLKYEEHLRDQVKQLGAHTAAEIKKLEQRNKQQKLGENELEHIKKDVVEKCVLEIDQKKKQEERDELEVKKTKDSQIKNIETKLESLEKEKRKKNRVIYNLQESNKTEAGQRYDEDRANIQKIFTQELLRDGFKVERIIRLGKRTEGRRRPTLVEMRNENEKMDILINAKKLRHSVEYPKLYINKDLTFDERMNEKQLRDQLKEKRDNGETGYTIRNGKLVNKRNNLQADENNNDIPQPFDYIVTDEELGAVGGGARRKTTGNFQ